MIAAQSVATGDLAQFLLPLHAVRRFSKRKIIGVLASTLLLLAGGIRMLTLSEKAEWLDAEKLRLNAADLRSFAGEEALLATQALAGKLLATYFAVQSAMLKNKSQEIQRSLASAAAWTPVDNSM